MITTNAGDLLKTSHPYAHVIANKERETRCDQCLQIGKLQRCSACHTARYCNRVCQKEAWKFHKHECACFQRVSPKLPTDSVLLFYRLVLRHQWGDDKKITTEYLGRNRSFMDLMSHEEDIQHDHARMDEFIELCHTLKMFVGDNYELPNSEMLLTIFGKMVINTFTITDGEMQPIGSGIYLGPSVLDHSCCPDAVVVFNGTDLQLRATTYIDARCVEQVFISYIDLLIPSTERQTALEKQYYFTCECAHCIHEYRDFEMTASSCPTENCDEPIMENEDGKLLPCESCKRTTFPKDYSERKTEALSEIKELLIKCTKWKAQGDADAILTDCKNFLASQGTILHPQNVYRVQLVDRLFDACIDKQLWEDALEYGKKNTEPYVKFYPENHPSVPIHLMKVGKIQLFLEHLTDALITLQKAETILRVTHGKEHPLFCDLVQLLNQCEDELRSKGRVASIEDNPEDDD